MRFFCNGNDHNTGTIEDDGYITVQLEDAASQAAAPWVSLLDDAAKIVTSRLGPDRFRVAGTAEFAGEDRALV